MTVTLMLSSNFLLLGYQWEELTLYMVGWLIPPDVNASWKSLVNLEFLAWSGPFFLHSLLDEHWLPSPLGEHWD